MGTLSAQSVTAAKRAPGDWVSNVGTATGALCVVLTLLLYSPGVRVVRADDAPPETLVSVDPTFDGTVDFSALDSAPDAAALFGVEVEPTAPACGAATNARSRQLMAVEERLHLEIASLRRSAPAPGSGVVMLNNRGYSYRDSDGPGAVSGLEDSQVLMERLREAR